MPHLMVNLEDTVDCRQGMEILRQRIREAKQSGVPEKESRPSTATNRGEEVANLPLPQKLKRIQSRGMWKHLLRIAKSVSQPLSLPEFDEHLDLPKNKMRSLKANMAKLENRFDLKFLRVDEEAGADAAGNPRYVMAPRMRNQILRLAEQTVSAE